MLFCNLQASQTLIIKYIVTVKAYSNTQISKKCMNIIYTWHIHDKYMSYILKYYDDIFIQTRRLALTYIANLFFNTFDKISYHSFLLRLSEYNSIKCYMYHTNMYYVGTLLSSLPKKSLLYSTLFAIRYSLANRV